MEAGTSSSNQISWLGEFLETKMLKPDMEA